MNTNQKRERKDWALLIFIIPIGILLLLFVGQLAARLVPFWSANVGMNSNLEPNADGARPFALLEPILPQILTPLAWAETYLTPGAEISFPPFLTFEPTVTPTPTTATPTATEATPTQTPTATGTPVPTSTSPTGTAPTSNPTDEGTNTPTATSTSPTPSASPTTPSPSPTTPSPSPTTPSPSPTTPSPTATPTGTPIVLPTDQYTEETPPPEIGTIPDGDVGPGIADGTYVIIDFSGTPIIVLATPDDFYDLIFYELEDTGGPGGYIQFDHIIIGITNDISLGYYEVFNWGNNQPDTNSNANVDELSPDPFGAPCPSGDECDNYDVDMDELYPTPGTGILIDVDTAAGAPPPTSYNFVVIIAPTSAVPSDNAQVDAIIVTEVPTPTPVATP